MITRPHALLAAALASLAVPGWPQQPVAVELHHRSAESLITVLRPLIGRAALAGAGAQLQVRAPPSDLARVVRLIEQSDLPLRALVVAQREDPPATGERQSAGRAGSVTLSTGQAVAPDPHGNGQLLSTQSSARPARIVEGDPLPVSMPAPQSFWFGAHGASSGAGTGSSRGPGAAGVARFEAISDFTARIWVAGETVAIDLSPRAGGRIDAGPDTGLEPMTVYGRLGQWIALADSGPQAGAAARAGLWIRVEAAPRPAGAE